MENENIENSPLNRAVRLLNSDKEINKAFFLLTKYIKVLPSGETIPIIFKRLDLKALWSFSTSSKILFIRELFIGFGIIESVGNTTNLIHQINIQKYFQIVFTYKYINSDDEVFALSYLKSLNYKIIDINYSSDTAREDIKQKIDKIYNCKIDELKNKNKLTLEEFQREEKQSEENEE